MKKIFPGLFIAMVYLLVTGCRKNNDANLPLTAAERQRIAALGLRSEGASRHGDDYLVEGDILLTQQQLQQGWDFQLHGSSAEHYRTSSIVTGLPRTITIRYSGSIAAFSNALNNAASCFNALGLRLRLQRVAAGTPANITIADATGVNYISAAGFPAGGNPYNSISLNTAFAARPAAFITRIILHAFGHCIGYQHTDFNSPLITCYGFPAGGGSGGGVGAILIPGTTSGPDPGSWMNTCPNYDLGCSFSSFDRIALNALYQ